MTSRNEGDYLRARAKREREIASTCEDNSAALAHPRMADEYDRRARVMAIARSPFPAPV